jgi:hypothetical protein
MSFETCKATCVDSRAGEPMYNHMRAMTKWPSIYREFVETATQAEAEDWKNCDNGRGRELGKVFGTNPPKSRGEEIAVRLVTWHGPDEDGCLHFHRLDWNAGQRLDLLSDAREQLRAAREYIAAAIDQVIAEEREADARIAEDPAIHAVFHDEYGGQWSDGEETKRQIAAAIRARGAK